MGIMDNEGHDPLGFGNVRSHADTEIERRLRAEIERLRADNEHLRELLRGDDPPEIDRLRATLTAITKVSRDDWEFRDGEPVPKWWLLASDAIAVEQSKEKTP